ncbi:MAG: hypothetical protein AB7G47_19885 [Mycolicibacterium sp.]|uniref:hypothetical protein n=1 Tax=Mycolicibacterium sp. TaxID=2320850 RepID=UPI003D14E348
MTTRGPIPPRLRELDRLAQTHGWDSMSFRQLGAAHDGYLFTRAGVEVDVRANRDGKIVRAVRTAPAEPPSDPAAGHFQTVKTWLTATPRPATGDPARFTRVRRGPFGGIELTTHDSCRQCHGPITNRSILGPSNRWVHLHDSDWADNVHHAVPVGGAITSNDQPGPWLVAGDPR